MVTVLRKEMMAPYLSLKGLTKMYPEKHPKVEYIRSKPAGNFSIYIYEINVIYNRL